MINLTYAQIRDQGFNPLLTKLLQSKMPYGESKRLVDLLYVIRDHQAKSDELWGLLTDKYKDVHQSAETKAQVESDVTEFMHTPVKIDQAPLPEKMFESLEMSGADILLLKGLIG